MKAYVYGAKGPEITDVPKPAPKGTQILVKVHACGLNRADLGMTKGHAHGSAGGVGAVLGMEWSGEVAELGPDAKGVKVGDRIMGSGGAARSTREAAIKDERPSTGTLLDHNLQTITAPGDGTPVLQNFYKSSDELVQQIYGGTNASGPVSGWTGLRCWAGAGAGMRKARTTPSAIVVRRTRSPSRSRPRKVSRHGWGRAIAPRGNYPASCASGCSAR